MKTRRILVAVTAGLVLATAAAAHAAGPPYTVSVGGSSATGAHSFSAASTGVVKFRTKNASGTIINHNCTALTVSGSVTSGTGITPVATIASTTWSGCTIPGGALTITQSGAWNLTGTGANATSGSETIAGYLGGVNGTMKTTANPNICSFAFAGQMNASFDESTQQITISETGYSGNLVLSNVRGCLGQWQNGNKMDIETTLAVASPDGAINLS